MKLVVHERDSDLARSLFEAASELVTASLGYVEARWALGAASRAGRLRGARSDQARVELEELWRDVSVVRLDDHLVGRAGDVAELLRLRAGHAIHLTSALALDDAELVFATWDQELQRAAREAGLAVAP